MWRAFDEEERERKWKEASEDARLIINFCICNLTNFTKLLCLVVIL